MFDHLLASTRLPSFTDFVLTTFDRTDATIPLNTRVLAQHICCGMVSTIHLQSLETLRHHLEMRGDLELDYDELREATDNLWDEFAAYTEDAHSLQLPYAYQVAGSHCVLVAHP